MNADELNPLPAPLVLGHTATPDHPESSETDPLAAADRVDPTAVAMASSPTDSPPAVTTAGVEIHQAQAQFGQFVQDSLKDLEERRESLLRSIEQLEKRRDRAREEMRQSFAGVSQDLAVRVQGFKEYLVGSLQDLAAAAEQLNLVSPTAPTATTNAVLTTEVPEKQALKPKFAESEFRDDRPLVDQIIQRYRSQPDYYGPAWQLRRTFEQVHAERVTDWFFNLGGRGSIRSLGSRLQNILVASAIISIFNELYGERFQALILANSPECLGDWRRGLQDCLGLAREDFGPNQGIAFFELPDALIQKADRLDEAGDLPLIIIDEGEGAVSLGILEFPLWLAFAPDPANPTFTPFGSSW
jgi:glutathione S-transferase